MEKLSLNLRTWKEDAANVLSREVVVHVFYAQTGDVKEIFTIKFGEFTFKKSDDVIRAIAARIKEKWGQSYLFSLDHKYSIWLSSEGDNSCHLESWSGHKLNGVYKFLSGSAVLKLNSPYSEGIERIQDWITAPNNEIEHSIILNEPSPVILTTSTNEVAKEKLGKLIKEIEAALKEID